MGRWADWIPITIEQAERFADAWLGGDEEVNELLEPLFEVPAHVYAIPESNLGIEKMWVPIHRCLTGDHGPGYSVDIHAGEPPLHFAVMGGEPMLRGGHCSLSLVWPEEVSQVAEALASVSREWFRERFMALPDDQYHEISERECDAVWEQFERLAAFYAVAARDGMAVLCHISH
jgi:Domain of unknown function (DUF1877)